MKEELYTLRWLVNNGWGNPELQSGADKLIDQLLDGPKPVDLELDTSKIKKAMTDLDQEWRVAKPNPSPQHIVCLDPGHGGHDSGAWNRRTKLREKDVVLRVAKKAGQILENHFVQVVYTRDDDRFLELSTRAAISNKAKADVFVSIHCNDAKRKSASGIETFYKNARDLAESIQVELADIPGHKDRGIKRANYSVLRRTACDAALVECEFIDHIKQGKWLGTEAAEDALAMKIATGILNYLH